MVKIKVPATSANMGPGFDCLGVALDMYNEYSIDEYDGETMIKTGDPCFDNCENLVYTSMQRCFDEIGYNPHGIKLISTGSIPVSRGLGSSAACIVAGVVGANYLAGNKLSTSELLKLCTQIEGHPDNVVPAMLGGMVVSFLNQNEIYFEKIKIKDKYRFCALIPDFKLSTADARAVLPTQIPAKDSIFNISRACMMIAALANGNPQSLRVCFEDKLHQQYRGRLIPGFHELMLLSKDCGSLGTFLSGAGPTIMTLVEYENRSYSTNMKARLSTDFAGWRIEELSLDTTGTTIVLE